MGPHPLSDGIQDPGSVCLRDLLLILVIAIYLTVQITVPAIGLLERGGFLFGGSDLTHWDKGQVKFGWQMFRPCDKTTSTTSWHATGRYAPSAACACSGESEDEPTMRI